MKLSVDLLKQKFGLMMLMLFFFIQLAISEEGKNNNFGFFEYNVKNDQTYKLQEVIRRDNQYKSQVQQIENDNKDSLEVNIYTDQMNNVLSNLRSQKRIKERTKIASTAKKALTYKKGKRVLVSNSSVYFDWSSKINLTSVKNTGFCSASWAFSTTSFFQADSIISLNSSFNLDLSQQFLITCDFQNQFCTNGYIETSIDLVTKKGGIPLQYKFPYSPFSMQPSDICKTKDIYKVTNQYRMSYYDIQDQQIIKKIVLKKPASINICANDLIDYFPGKDQESKILRCKPINTVLNLAVLLVGFNEKYWIIKNSWGKEWGINGYAYISRKTHQSCCIGEEIHTTGMKSDICTVQYCELCIQQFTCFKCSPDRYVYHQQDTGIQKCQLCKIDNCRQCLNYYGNCKQCKNGYAINQHTGKCQLFSISNCNQFQQKKCLQCNQGYAATQDQLVCKAFCDVRNCQKCIQGPCTQCYAGFSLTLVNQTMKCIKNSCNVSNCDLCNASGQCIKCSIYFNLNGTKCQSNCTQPKCLACNANDWLCIECASGYSFNYWIQVCQSFSFNYCGIHLFGKCYQCKPGYDFDYDRTTCLQICYVNNCVSCQKSDITVCLNCQPGYQLQIINDQTFCKQYPCSIQNCISCSQDGNTCLACITKYHIYNSVSKKCQINCQLDNCELCLPSDDICGKCKSGYIFQYDSQQCYRVDIPHCTLVGFWDDTLQCWQCQPKFQVDLVSWFKCLINCTDQFCQLCDIQTLMICSKCFDGYHQYNIDGKLSCLQVPSLMTQCQLISFNQTYCFMCNAYFYYDYEALLCLPYKKNCSDLCQYCAVPGSQTTGCKCQLGFAYDVFTQECGINPFDDTCVQIGQVNTKMYCWKCSQGYALSADYLGCRTCSVSNCVICYPQIDFACMTCSSGYYLNSNYTCNKCSISNCNTCTQVRCINCQIGYKLSPSGNSCTYYSCNDPFIFDGFSCACPLSFFLSNNNCSKCQQTNCGWCDSNGCIQCLEGYYISLGQCYLCMQKCLQCSTFDNCQKCNESYFFEPKQLKCIQIIKNKIYKKVNQSVIECPTGCLQCDQQQKCTKCIESFARIETSACVPCQKLCKQCYYNLPSGCKSCINGYFLFQKTCLPCKTQNCTLCSNDINQCVKCIDRFYLKNNKCIKCFDNCLSCNTNGQCKQCLVGYTITENKTCQQCLQTCTYCNSKRLETCQLHCIQQQYEANGVCQSCSQNCKACYSLNQCKECFSGFILKNGFCNMFCNTGCFVCSRQNNSICSQCFAGYTLSNQSKCNPNIACNITNSCRVCPQWYILKGSNCYACKTDQNCIECSYSNITQCISCVQGYYIDNKVCKQCQSPCKSCYRNGLCTVCSEGFYLISIESNLAGKCLQCSPICKTCSKHSFNCLSCNSGYELTVHKKCLSKQKIQTKIRLNYQFNLFYQISDSIKYDLAGLMGENYLGKTQYSSINSIENGSIIIHSYLGIPPNENINSIFATFNGKLKSLSTLGGAPIEAILYSQLTTYIIVPENNNNTIINVVSDEGTSKVTIILAVVIPCSVIILIIFGVVIKLRISRTNSVLNAEISQVKQQTIQQKQDWKKKQRFQKLQPLHKNRNQKSHDYSKLNENSLIQKNGNEASGVNTTGLNMSELEKKRIQSSNESIEDLLNKFNQENEASLVNVNAETGVQVGRNKEQILTQINLNNKQQIDNLFFEDSERHLESNRDKESAKIGNEKSENNDDKIMNEQQKQANLKLMYNQANMIQIDSNYQADEY